MKNWIIDEKREELKIVGEFFVQFSTVEWMIGEIYKQYSHDKVSKFYDATFGGKIKMLAAIVKIEFIEEKLAPTHKSIKERLDELNRFRIMIAHNCFQFDPNGKNVLVKGKSILMDIEKRNALMDDLLTDLYLVFLSIKNNPQYKLVISKKHDLLLSK